MENVTSENEARAIVQEAHDITLDRNNAPNQNIVFVRNPRVLNLPVRFQNFSGGGSVEITYVDSTGRRKTDKISSGGTKRFSIRRSSNGTHVIEAALAPGQRNAICRAETT